MNMAPSGNLVLPMANTTNDQSQRWMQLQLAILNEIVNGGTVKPQYKHNLCCRIYRVTAASICAVSVCVPILLYDSVCCCINIWCCGGKSKVIYGCGFQDLNNSYKDAFADNREKELIEIGKSVNPVVYTQVCTAYLNAFDSCLANGKAMNANIIRGKLVSLMRRSAPDLQCLLLQDDGDIDNLRRLVHSYQNKYCSV
jgi:hypothetical protein